jgi:hypothetical protein
MKFAYLPTKISVTSSQFFIGDSAVFIKYGGSHVCSWHMKTIAAQPPPLEVHTATLGVDLPVLAGRDSLCHPEEFLIQDP